MAYLGGTLLLSGPAGLPIQVAILAAYLLSLAAHFSLQRFLVFRDHDAFELAVQEQAGRYLAIAALQYGLVAGATAVLPGVLGLDEHVVYVTSALTAAVLTFLVLRAHVFHAQGLSE